MNPFIPTNCEFEILGFFEELLDATTYKVIGCRDLDEPNRPVGSPGTIEYDVTENLTLTKGLRQVVLKASPKRPRRVLGTIQIKCGRVKGR